MDLKRQQEKNILAWRKQGVPGAERIRVTDAPQRMLAAPGRAPSFLDVTDFPVPPTDREGAPGVYWRGVEGFPKVKGCVCGELIADRRAFDAEASQALLYTMVHGLLPVPPGIREATERGDVSTWHDTAFMRDVLPGTRQAASTGAGHFQGLQLDLKEAVEGWGIQFNVRYDARGQMTRILAQRMVPGRLVLALPGHVDYVVNAGNLRFNDISLRLSEEAVRGFPGGEKPASLERAPYAAAPEPAGELVYVKASADAPVLEWADPRGNIWERMGARNLMDFYLRMEQASIVSGISIIKQWFSTKT